MTAALLRRPFRVLDGLRWAERCEARPLPRPNSPVARQGRAYERNVKKALERLCTKHSLSLEYEPWFRFEDAFGWGQIVPDFLVHDKNFTLVIDAKLTWNADGSAKLQHLYLPVLRLALPSLKALHPLIVCRHLTPQSQLNVDTLSAASKVHTLVPSLQWLGQGPIIR